METNINEESIKKQLGINSWRELSKNKVFDLLNMIEMNPNISKDVYIEILKNVPQFIDAFKESISALKDTISQSNKSSEESKRYYSRLADNLIRLISKQDLTDKDKDNIFIILQQINVYIGELDKRDREFFNNALKVGGTIALVIIAVIGSISGIKAFQKIPTKLI